MLGYADSALCLIGQKVTNEVALSATISMRPIPSGTPEIVRSRSLDRCLELRGPTFVIHRAVVSQP